MNEKSGQARKQEHMWPHNSLMRQPKQNPFHWFIAVTTFASSCVVAPSFGAIEAPPYVKVALVILLAFAVLGSVTMLKNPPSSKRNENANDDGDDEG